MHGYGYGSMWPMGAMMFGWLVLTVLAVAVVVWAVVRFSSPGAGGHDTSTARRILDERYARGELDTEEYSRRLTALR